MSDSANKSFPVSKYLTAVRRLLTEQVPPIWVNGVITQLSMRDKVCYLTLAEYAENDVKPVAQVGLFLFANEFRAIQAKLAALPQPFTLAAELKVSLLLQSDFYIPQGKFQPKVIDIDPVHTLGELALTRKAILQRLDREGLMHKNKSTVLGAAPLGIGLITSEGSAACHDFLSVLKESGLCFRIESAWAQMQGNGTESSVLAALGKLAALDSLDCVCIVRGGGSRTDLNYFDSEAICRAIAHAPWPVLTGIGHEIDQSLCDLVSWRSCITPTDTAKFLVATVKQSWERTMQLVRSVGKGASLRLQSEKVKIGKLQSLATQGIPKRLARESERLISRVAQLRRSATDRLVRQAADLQRNRQGLHLGTSKILSMAKVKLEFYPVRIKAVDPQSILSRGYSLTTDAKGKFLTDPKQIGPGSVLQTKLAWGVVQSKVEKIHPSF